VNQTVYLKHIFLNELGSKKDDLPLFISPFSFSKRAAVGKEGVNRESKECVTGCERRLKKENKFEPNLIKANEKLRFTTKR
jgi:hypothetical protein